MYKLIVFITKLTLIASLVTLEHVSSSPIELLDSDESRFDEIVELVCDAKHNQKANDESKQVSKFETIGKIYNYFASLPDGHKHSECHGKYFESIRSLNDVVQKSNSNVCSDQKITLIENFHNKFVSLARNHIEQHQAVPHLLRSFFMLYSMEISMMCKRTLINNLEWDVARKFPGLLELYNLDTLDGERVGELFNGAVLLLMDAFDSKNFDDIILLWPLIEDSYLAQRTDELLSPGGAIFEEFDEQLPGQALRLLVKTRSAQVMNNFRRACYQKYKPIYGELIMPIVRLSNLGYTNNGDEFERELAELRQSELVKRWYKLTQLCEAALPVKFYEDSSLHSNELIMITKHEAQQLETNNVTYIPDNQQQMINYKPTTNGLLGRRSLEHVHSSEIRKMIRRIKLNESSKDQIRSRAMSHLIRYAVRSLKGNFRKIFLSKEVATSNKIRLESNQDSSTKNERSIEINTHKIEQDLSSMSDEDLMQLCGASKRLVKGDCGADSTRGVAKRRIRRRKGDRDLIYEIRARELSYTHTKSWNEIVTEWAKSLSVLAPSRMQLVVFGTIVVGLLVALMAVTILVAAASALG